MILKANSVKYFTCQLIIILLTILLVFDKYMYEKIIYESLNLLDDAENNETFISKFQIPIKWYI